MNAFMRYFSWLNRVFDRNKERGFIVRRVVWCFYMAMALCGMVLMIAWAAISIVWEILSFLFGTIKRIYKSALASRQE